MIAKDRMIDLLETTANEQQYTFIFEGSTAEANDYIHKMRVELSRMRESVRNAGHIVAHFKIRKVSIRFNPATAKTEIVLLKTVTKGNVDDKVAQVMGVLAVSKTDEASVISKATLNFNEEIK